MFFEKFSQNVCTGRLLKNHKIRPNHDYIIKQRTDIVTKEQCSENLFDGSMGACSVK